MKNQDVVLEKFNLPESDDYDPQDCTVRHPQRTSELRGVGNQQILDTVAKITANEVRAAHRREMATLREILREVRDLKAAFLASTGGGDE